jgi:hypothetical protein
LSRESQLPRGRWAKHAKSEVGEAGEVAEVAEVACEEVRPYTGDGITLAAFETKGGRSAVVEEE